MGDELLSEFQQRARPPSSLQVGDADDWRDPAGWDSLSPAHHRLLRTHSQLPMGILAHSPTRSQQLALQGGQAVTGGLSHAGSVSGGARGPAPSLALPP